MKNQVMIVTIVILFSIAGLILTSQSSGYATFESNVFDNFLYNVKTIPLFVVSTKVSETELEYTELLQEIVYKRMSSDLRPKTIYRVPIDMPTSHLEMGDPIGKVMPSLTEQKIIHFGKPQRTFVPRGALNKEGILLDSEAYAYTKYDKIILGNPCKNSFMMEYLYNLENCSYAFVETNKFVKLINEDGRKTLLLGAKNDEALKSLVLEII